MQVDVAIVGGGASGLSAALILGLARRRVALFDAGPTRNAVAAVSHGYFTRDGESPQAIQDVGREQLKAYPHVVRIEERIVDGTVHASGVELRGERGTVVHARKAILANGVSDQLPEVPGIAECWGKSLFACPYCHAYDHRDQPLAVISNGVGVAGNVALLRVWSADVVLCTNGPAQFETSERYALYQNRVPVYETPIVGFRHVGGQLEAIQFADGTELARRAALYSPTQRATSDLPIRLGLIREHTFQVNPQNAQTSHPHVYVAGDLVSMFSPQILASAAYSGAFTARHVNYALANEDFLAALG